MAVKKKKKRTAKLAGLSTSEVKLLKKLLAKAGDEPLIEQTRAKGSTPKLSRNPLVGNKKRISTSDGELFFIRLKKANPAAQERVKKLVEAGDYIYERTDDDVVVYRYSDGSKHKRKKATISEMTNGQIIGEMMRSACARDFPLYAEAAGELAFRFKSSDMPQGVAEKSYIDMMQYIELRIARRGGPSQIEIGSHLSRLRQERRGTQIFLPH